VTCKTHPLFSPRKNRLVSSSLSLIPEFGFFQILCEIKLLIVSLLPLFLLYASDADHLTTWANRAAFVSFRNLSDFYLNS